jgi:hypothetical protein
VIGLAVSQRIHRVIESGPGKREEWAAQPSGTKKGTVHSESIAYSASCFLVSCLELAKDAASKIFDMCHVEKCGLDVVRVVTFLVPA